MPIGYSKSGIPCWKFRNPQNANFLKSQFQKEHKVNVGRKHSKKSRHKMSLSKLKEKNPMYGKKYSEETKKKEKHKK
ncbi:hypothetical protein LCGC14_1629180 [marine sediment metagenome]|uniref:Nuclease associated modular domain-containing protein n=1 Tax=marine sediment metagenome TaxID=412755 RepID=A0A0F9IQ88_9ZZZZ